MDREEEELETADTEDAVNQWYDYVPLVLMLVNYGASECSACGERYRYVQGKPLLLED